MCINIDIPKYNLLCLHTVTWMFVFRADNLLLDSQLVYFSLRKTISPGLTIS